MLAILHERMVFRVVIDREVVHSGILPRLVSDLWAFEKPLGIVRLHLFREYQKVEQGPKPLHRMTLWYWEVLATAWSIRLMRRFGSRMGFPRKLTVMTPKVWSIMI